MMTASVMVGSADVGAMVCGPAPAILKAMMSGCPPTLAEALASVMACRKLPAPLSLVFVTVNVVAPVATATHGENSEVLFAGSVAVAVTNSPGTVAVKSVVLIVALPPASVLTVVEPKKVRPSPLPDVSHAALLKEFQPEVVGRRRRVERAGDGRVAARRSDGGEHGEIL